jgi:hypothetical protein
MDDLTHEENLAIQNAEMAYEDLVEEMSSYGVSESVKQAASRALANANSFLSAEEKSEERKK